MKLLIIQNSPSFARVDDEDFERLSKFKWHLTSTGSVYRTHYSKSSFVSVKSRYINISLAKEVMQNFELMFDHEDRDKLNNLKSNIRQATTQQNNCNRGKTKGCSSAYKGVTYRERAASPWYSSIRFNSKLYHLGAFKTEELAAKAYDIKAKELFGKFAVLNFS